MEENEDEPAGEGFATPDEDEEQRNQMNESNEGYSTPLEDEVTEETIEDDTLTNKNIKDGTATKKKKDDDEDCCTTKKRMKSKKELKWRNINIFEKECKPPKSNPVPRHCVTKKEYLNILSTPRQICPPPCLQKVVIRKLAPVSPRILELAKPSRHRILRTIQDHADTLAPDLLDNLIKMLEVESSLSPEQARKLFREKKSNLKKKRKKKRRKVKCKEKEREKEKANIDQPRLDPEAVCCQYQMAEKFVKSILDWKCPMAKEEFQDISKVILRRLSTILGYTPTNDGDRRSQQIQFLANVISCWINGVIIEIAEVRKESEDEERRRREEEEETDEEDMSDGIYRDKDDDDDDEDDYEGAEDKGKRGKGKKDKGKGDDDKQDEDKEDEDKEDEAERESKADDEAPEDKEKSESAPVELEDKAIQEEPEGQETASQAQPEVAEKETEVDVREEEELAGKEIDGEKTDEEPAEATGEDPEEILEDDVQDKAATGEEAEEKEDEGDKEKKEEEKPVDEETGNKDVDLEKVFSSQKDGSLKLFQTDLPFINFIQIFSTIYKTMDAEEENMGDDPIVNRVHRAVYEKCANAVKLEDPNLLTNNAKDVIDVMAGKVAIFLSKTLTDSQINLFNKYPPQVESFEVRDWSKWLNNTTKTAKNWSEWLQSLIKEINKMQDGKISRGQWADWTKQVDTDAALWRRFYLDTVHQAHHNAMMIRGREVVKTGEKNFPVFEKEIKAFDL